MVGPSFDVLVEKWENTHFHPCPPVCAGIGRVSGPVIEMTYDPRFSKKKSVNVIQSSPLDTRFPRKPTFVRNNVFKALIGEWRWRFLFVSSKHPKRPSHTKKD